MDDAAAAPASTLADAGDEPGDAGPEGLVEQVRRILGWASTTPTGDRGELPFEPRPRAWSMLSVGPRECPGAFRCPSGGECFAEAARAEAAAADVVVVNSHLYGAHLAAGGTVLPAHDIVIFDEAHELEEVMTACLGVEVSPGRFRALVNLARPVLRGASAAGALDDLSGTGDRLHAELSDRTGDRVLRIVDGAGPAEGVHGTDGTNDTDGTDGVRGTDRTHELRERDRRLEDTLALGSHRLNQLTAMLAQGAQSSLLLDGATDEGRRARALSAAGHLSEDLARVLGRTDELVAWVDGTPGAPVLRLSPIDVGPPLAEILWDEVTAVLTSATIPVRLPERLGLSASAVDEVDFGSPFDYRSHSLLYVARHLPDRRSPESEAAMHDELEALVSAAGGRTLALFTSRRATEAAAAELRLRLPYTVLVQGELPKARLLEAFTGEESSCLFATLSFWQGVDVPGRSLTLVTLDRLPFARPDDPLFQARRERAGDAAFRLVDLPRAATLLAQGAGRLVRAADDHGVVAVLDPRLASAGYRGVLLAALPPMRRTTERRQVEDFLARVLADPGAPGVPVSQGPVPSAPVARRRSH